MLSIILGFILTISILVFIHEYGHYIVAKMYKVKILEFSIGFGKELYSFTDKAGVVWKISLIPLGGFVKMYKDDSYQSANNTDVRKELGEFYAKPAYQRFCIIAAGPLANFLLALLIFTGFYFFHGKLVIPPIIEQVVENSPAKHAGIKPGDKIIAVRGKQITDFTELREQLILDQSLPLPMQVKRDDQLLNITVTSYLNTADKSPSSTPLIGVRSEEGYFVKSGIFASIYFANAEIANVSSLTLKMLKQMILGQRSSDQLHGPITIANESAKSLNSGFSGFILFLAMISINLGLVNLLPIPILDGGHLLFTTYEMIVGKALSPLLQTICNKIGLAIIIFMIIISLSNDIKSLIT